MTAQKAEPAHIEDIPESTTNLRELISSGRAFLKVVAYPWGVEFDVYEGRLGHGL